ncbi:MAG: MBL fold metallo-hydrolase [Acidobacteria bacterium]|nr:MAG: MBL fold metallo-hydrolase [Acidobacteriota bacterium]
MERRVSSRYPAVWVMLAVLALFACLPETANTAGPDPLSVTVLYDNIPFEKNLQTHWGFSCLVQKGSTRVLFDTGAQGETLLGNLKKLNVDLTPLDAIVFSHIHNDHTGGYSGLKAELVTDPPVYVLKSFPAEFKQQVKAIEVSDPIIFPDTDFRTTGEVPGQPVNEQALIVRTPRGLVVVTGCAHPGIVNLLRRATEVSGEKIHLVIGGFHLLQTPTAEVEQIVRQFRSLGVERVAPSHCTGEAAIGVFRKAYGTNFVESGVGKILQIDTSSTSN